MVKAKGTTIPGVQAVQKLLYLVGENVTMNWGPLSYSSIRGWPKVLNQPVKIFAFPNASSVTRTRHAKAIGEVRRESDGRSSYGPTCMEITARSLDGALEHLAAAMAHGELNTAHVRQVPDLDWIRNDPRFEELPGADG